MKRISLGVLAHVDAGKTTLSEALLYESGTISRLGRVDNQDAFLDTEGMERARGITIYSKQAVMRLPQMEITLLDTPGHVDFSAEMERALWVMDYAVLVISGSDGVQGHTVTLWKLLERYGIPVFIFVNKMDQPETDAHRILAQLQREFGEGFVAFGKEQADTWKEQAAVCSEEVLERYLETEDVTDADICRMIADRQLFPCYFGSALKMQGITEFIDGMASYMQMRAPQDAFAARVYKISRDEKGNRLTHMKITGGVLQVKDLIRGTDRAETGSEDSWQEKVQQIRHYSGGRYEALQEACQGMVCAVTGLTRTYPGEGLGTEQDAAIPLLEPVMTYQVILPEEVSPVVGLTWLRQLEEEEPELHIAWQEETQTIEMHLMGDVQTDVVRRQLADRFGVDVRFGNGKIAYKETIADTVEGVGHFEPLRHYAEVHLLLEPGERGTGIQILSDCSEDILDKNWQRLVLTHIAEQEHPGVLTGAPITDMRITLIAGRAHNKHTEGGDFRQATYRAIRQGLMQADSVLLEPYYAYRLEIPADCVGRAMSDIEQRHGTCSGPQLYGDRAILEGSAPVAAMQDYAKEVYAYSKGRGRIFCRLKGYERCHNAEEVIEQTGYRPEEDTEHPSASVFCAHGAGFLVPWNEVSQYMHIQTREPEGDREDADWSELADRRQRLFHDSIDEEQIEAIMNRTFHANERPGKRLPQRKKKPLQTTYRGKPEPKYKDRYLIVDGYNIVHAWDSLKELLPDHLDAARMKLLDILSNYQAFTEYKLIVVFDAYKVKGNIGTMYEYGNLHVVYTKEAETADTYIEKLTHEIAGHYRVRVATSDGLVQLITRGQNCEVLSARELLQEVEQVQEQIRTYLHTSEEL